MISDFLGPIGGLEFVDAESAFTEAVNAQRNGTFGSPDTAEHIHIHRDAQIVADATNEQASAPTVPPPVQPL